MKQKNRGNVYSCRKLRKEEIKGRKHQRSHSQLVDQPELPLPSEVTFGLRLLHSHSACEKSSLVPGPHSGGSSWRKGVVRRRCLKGSCSASYRLPIGSLWKVSNVSWPSALTTLMAALVPRRGPFTKSLVGAEEEMPNKGTIVRKVGKKSPCGFSWAVCGERNTLPRNPGESFMAHCHGLGARLGGLADT